MSGFDTEYEVFRAQVQRDILDAYRPTRRWRLWYAVTLGPWRHRKQRAQLASLIAAGEEARRREAEYVAALPGRMAAAAERINAKYADVLPEGMRFEWAERPPPGAIHQFMPEFMPGPGGDRPPGAFFLRP